MCRSILKKFGVQIGGDTAFASCVIQINLAWESSLGSQIWLQQVFVPCWILIFTLILSEMLPVMFIFSCNKQTSFSLEISPAKLLVHESFLSGCLSTCANGTLNQLSYKSFPAWSPQSDFCFPQETTQVGLYKPGV